MNENRDFDPQPLLQVLSNALRRALGSYEEFSCRAAPENAKDFTAHHNACKAALGHLGALVKLQDAWRKTDKNGNEACRDIESLLLRARSVLLENGKENDENENQF